MDLNELLWQHQRAILMASRPAGARRRPGFDLVGHYAERIRKLRVTLGVSARPDWVARPV